MKKRLLVCSLVLVMAISMAIPALAVPAQANEFIISEAVENKKLIEPHGIEQTQIFWRTTSAGQLQFRVWSITNGRWITDWLNA